MQVSGFIDTRSLDFSLCAHWRENTLNDQKHDTLEVTLNKYP